MSASETFALWGGRATVATTDPADLPAALEATRATVDAYDRACSRFRPDSELTRVNEQAGKPVPVGEVLLEAVQVALDAARLSRGAVDPTVGRSLVALGYDRDLAQLAAARGDEPIRIRAQAAPGWQTVEVNPARATVRLPPGVALDLGATAKALAADRAAARAHALTGGGVLVSLLGDVAVAGHPPPGGWPIHVTEDHRLVAAGSGQTIVISSGGLATSASGSRRWQTAAGPAHHLLDPATGLPTEGPWRVVSVAAASCVGANIASTAAFVHGRTAVPWLEELGLPARLVDRDGTVTLTCGWPAAEPHAPAVEAA